MKFKVSVGNINLLTALNHAYKHESLVFIPKIAKLYPFYARIVLKAKLYHFKVSSGKTVHLNRRRQFENIGHLMSRHHFGVNGHGKTKLLAHKIEIFTVVFGISYTDDCMGSSHLFAHKAAEHIKLIRAGGRNNKIGPFDRRLSESSAIGTVSAHPDNIINICYFGNNVGISVHGYNIVSLAHQA